MNNLSNHSTAISSARLLSHSQYQENKNIPSPNVVRKIRYEQPASIHLMKPKIDPSQQIYHYASSVQQQNNLNNNSPYITYQSNSPLSKSTLNKWLQVTPPQRTPLRSANHFNNQLNYNNNQINAQNQRNNENLYETNNTMSQLLERVDNLEQQFEQEKHSSFYQVNEKQHHQDQEKLKRARNQNKNKGLYLENSFINEERAQQQQQENKFNDESMVFRNFEVEVII